MSNDVTVGVQRWSGSREADDEHEANAEVTVQWVKIGDVVLTTEHLVQSVDYHADAGFASVVIRLTPSSFRTVDHRDGP